jgi:hypothetical protein
MANSYNDLEIRGATSRFRKAVRAIAEQERLNPVAQPVRGGAVSDLVSAKRDAALAARKTRRSGDH